MLKYFRFALLFIVVPACGQLQGADAHNNLQAMGSGSMMSRSFDARFKGVAGTPYLLGSFTYGGITMKSGKVFTFDSLNFDAYTNDVVVKRNNTPAEVNKSMLRRFWLMPNRIDTVQFVLLPGNEPEGEFFVLLLSDSVSLYKQPLKKWSQPNNTGAYSTGRTYSQFEYEEEFFYRQGSGEPVLIKNKKGLLSQFPAWESQLEDYIKQVRTNFKKEDDLKALFVYLNGLKYKG